MFWLIPFIPALSSLVLFFFGPRLSKKWIAVQASLAVLSSFALSVIASIDLIFRGAANGPAVKVFAAWIATGSFSARASLTFDPLAAVMALVVTGVGFLIHIYSAGYMAEDRRPALYFGFLNLFIFFMLLLILASNIVLMFVGWEGVGLCSYLLIGFWFERPSAAAAAKKAFLVNRIGDAAFLIGLLFILVTAGSAEFKDIGDAISAGKFTVPIAALCGILLFIGATGKSAQLPLYIWLPDAMAGPTPVSALIHAATMVTSGVYMICRMNVLFTFSATASSVVGITGGLTAFFAATMALTENNIKRVLAYSTISQIGIMFIGCGVGAYAAGMFHLFTHAFFKSLLFLCAGSVIHALHGEEDLRQMGGLKTKLPRTFAAFLIGAAALAGVPFFSGFFSKDAILSRAFGQGQYFVGFLGLAAAVLTAFYIFRLVFLVFYGQERRDSKATAGIHESPLIMTVPQFILAFFALSAGSIGMPAVLGEKSDFFGRFLAPVFLGAPERHLSRGLEGSFLITSSSAAIAGIVAAYVLYIRNRALPGISATRFPRITRVISRKYYVDEAYAAVFVQPLLRGSAWISKNIDLKVIDGTLNGTAAATGGAGKILSFGQTGLIKDYALVFLLGAVLFLGFLVF